MSCHVMSCHLEVGEGAEGEHGGGHEAHARHGQLHPGQALDQEDAQDAATCSRAVNGFLRNFTTFRK